MALEDAFRKSDPILWSPIMKVEVSTPDEFMGDVIGDLSSKTRPSFRDGKEGTIYCD